jgi:hypothetical protein
VRGGGVGTWEARRGLGGDVSYGGSSRAERWCAATAIDGFRAAFVAAADLRERGADFGRFGEGEFLRKCGGFTCTALFFPSSSTGRLNAVTFFPLFSGHSLKYRRPIQGLRPITRPAGGPIGSWEAHYSPRKQNSFNQAQPDAKEHQQTEKKLILTGAWYMWWERRQFAHGEGIQPVYRSASNVDRSTRNKLLDVKKGNHLNARKSLGQLKSMSTQLSILTKGRAVSLPLLGLQRTVLIYKLQRTSICC